MGSQPFAYMRNDLVQDLRVLFADIKQSFADHNPVGNVGRDTESVEVSSHTHNLIWKYSCKTYSGTCLNTWEAIWGLNKDRFRCVSCVTFPSTPVSRSMPKVPL